MTRAPRIVAFGGGHGLYATLTALRGTTEHLTAIVTVADDGGSSGRLRAELGIVPPGDLRMALSALCAGNEWGRTWRDVLQTRFETDGPLDGHALGNLLIATLWERTGDVVAGLEWVGRLLQAEGRVLPLSSEPLQVSATVRTPDGTHEVHGQVAVATADGVVEDLRLTPADPAVPPETVAAIDAADLVVLGPGSWYTSVLTHFMVDPVRDALIRAADRSVLVLNVGHEDEETAGMARVDDIAALRRVAPDFVPACVLVDADHAQDRGLAAAAADWGVELRVAPMREVRTRAAHDTARLRRALVAIARDHGLGVNAIEPTVAG
ncbi:uridine diphosphate-N-acetylglucosamine-binding protein YvcK [uncultured Demequina sp.]|uniref:gluconeogenesis factor YvcK family protein n=1 Tax=uncultured Demequina sp. TaxID=693499 RepID=UPI0025ED5A62|nr:uridine diphosphate-N-acetylglucosamine-binding protein YvcK [uncultured Demequina sp.]